jgi:hypothetical protein
MRPQFGFDPIDAVLDGEGHGSGQEIAHTSRRLL